MAKRVTKPKAEQPIMRGVKAIDPYDSRELPGAYVAATIITGEDVSTWYNNTGRDFELIARAAVGTPNHAVTTMATVCASQTLRLYRRSGGRPKSFMTRAVTDRRALKYLRGETPVPVSTIKGANYAAKAGDGVEEVLDHPVLDVLQNPDPVYTGQLWMLLLWWQREACGRSYIWAADWVGRGPSIPTSLYILPSAYTWPVKSTTGLIDSFVYGRNRAQMMRVQPETVVYLRHSPNPFDPVGAWGPLQSVTQEADMESAALGAEVARWNNGGMPGMVLKASPTTKDNQMAQMQAALSRSIQGVGKSGSMLLLRDTELVQYATKPHEMQYVQGMEHAQKRIYDAFGIPESIYRLNAANLASATVSDGQFARYAIAPRLAVMASELTEGLLPMFGIEPGEMWFAYDNPVRDDVIVLSAELRAAEAQGIVTPNEVRQVLGLDALPDEANVLRYRQTTAPAPAFDPFATTATDEEKKPEDVAVPVEATDAAAGADVQATALNGAQVQALADLATRVVEGQLPKASAQALAEAAFPLVNPITMDLIFGPLESFTPETPANAQATQTDEPETKALANGATHRACECGACCKGGGIGGGGVASDDTASAGSDSQVGPATKAKPKLKSFLTEWDEAAQVPKSTVKLFTQFSNAMQTWYAATMPAMVNDSLTVELPSPEAMRKFHQITDTFIGKVLENGAAVGIAKLPGATESTWNIANESAMKYVRDRSLELAKSVPETMKGSVQAIVEKELANPDGYTVDTVKQKINEAVPELSGYQAERLARTETADAFSEGELQAWKAEGVQNKLWVVGGGPCPDCEGLSAKYPDPIPIDAMFEYNGRIMERPTLHPNCQCSLSPGLEYDDETE